MLQEVILWEETERNGNRNTSRKHVICADTEQSHIKLTKFQSSTLRVTKLNKLRIQPLNKE